MNKAFSFHKVLLALLLLFPLQSRAQTKASFEDLQLDPFSYWNGKTSTYGDYTNFLEDSNFIFRNRFSRNDYGFGLYDAWSGFAYSRSQDDSTAGFENQYGAITAGGAFDSENYGILYLMYGSDTLWLKEPAMLDSVFLTNGTYPYLAMRDGDMFSKKFGGESGDDPDWFLLSITGLRNNEVTDTVEFYLADYRDSNNENDYIVDEWTKVDLSVLDTVDRLKMSLSSSDVGDFGMNTPAYFCMDNLSGADFEDLTYPSGDYWNGISSIFGSYESTFRSGPVTFPNQYHVNDYGTGIFDYWQGFSYSNMQDNTTAGYENQYSAYPASGVNGSSGYALCYNYYGPDTVRLDSSMEVSGFFVTNGTQGVISMREGDGVAKKFGGESGNDPDWFLLIIRGLNNGIYTNTIEYYLADYRFGNNDLDYIVTEWEWVDLKLLGEVDALEFMLSSSDTSVYGMNTPAYFFIDDVNDQAPEVVNPLPDLNVDNLQPEILIDISGVFTDPDDDDEAMEYSVSSVLPEDLLTASIEEQELILELTGAAGTIAIDIEALSNGRRAGDSFILTVGTGQSIESPEAPAFALYPNPAGEEVFIRTSDNQSFRIEIVNLYGQLVYTQPFCTSGEGIDISGLDAGIYIIRIDNRKASFTGKLRKL